MYLLDPHLNAPEPVTQTLSWELNLIETLLLCLFLKHSHTVALHCNVGSHNSNKWTFIFNASAVASLSTQHFGAKPVPWLATKIFGPPVKMCRTYFKTIGHARNQGEGGRSIPCKPFRPPGKAVGHRWKLLDIVWKFWAPLRKLFASPGVPSWLRAWAKPPDVLAFWRIIVMWHWSWDGYRRVVQKETQTEFYLLILLAGIL